MARIRVTSPRVCYAEDEMTSEYNYETTRVTSNADGGLIATPVSTAYLFKTQLKVPRVGCMLVGWGGNNGSTVTAMVLANRHRMTWPTRHGTQAANYYGSLTQSATVRLGDDADGGAVYVPTSSLLPMLHADDIVFDGWDISSVNLAAAMERAGVLDWNLQQQLRPHMENLKPRASIYIPDFIAANQAERADNVLTGTKQEVMEQVRADIRDFKQQQRLDKVIVLWTANTERFCDVTPGLNDTADELLRSIAADAAEVSPSTLFAVASILEDCCYINGAPQNTFVPGVIELASRRHVHICGDDFKSGQTRVKSVLADFLVSAGIKPLSIVSYNHLGNNDGLNLSEPRQFRSKEVTKSGVIDDVVASNRILYGDAAAAPDHCIVIRYVPSVGDSKRALDEYTSEIAMGGRNTLVLHNTCEDSLLAAPIVIDLIILAELCARVRCSVDGGATYRGFHAVLSVLAYLCKAPLVPAGAPVVNALFAQRACIENVLRACAGLPPVNNMGLEHKFERPASREEKAEGEKEEETEGEKEEEEEAQGKEEE